MLKEKQRFARNLQCTKKTKKNDKNKAWAAKLRIHIKLNGASFGAEFKKKKSYFLFLNPLQFAGRKWFLFEFLFEKHQSFCGSGTKTMLIWKHGRRIKCGTSWLNLSASLYTKRKLAERRELASSPWGGLSSSDIKCLQFCIIRKPFCYLLIGFIVNKCHRNRVKGAYTKVMPWMEPICTSL